MEETETQDSGHGTPDLGMAERLLDRTQLIYRVKALEPSQLHGYLVVHF
jgi:hypothetical protein